MEEVEGTEKDWPAQLILLSMGFLGPEQYVAEAIGSRGRSAKQLPSTFTASLPRTWTESSRRAIVDAVRVLVVWAINEGRGAARAIDIVPAGRVATFPPPA